MELDAVQVSTTVPDEDVAAAISSALVDARLAACVQVLGPVHSRYWWEGAIESSVEWLCVAKTTRELAPRAVDAVRAVHPYDVPEILVTPVVGGNPDYVDWIAASTRAQA